MEASDWFTLSTPFGDLARGESRKRSIEHMLTFVVLLQIWRIRAVPYTPPLQEMTPGSFVEQSG